MCNTPKEPLSEIIFVEFSHKYIHAFQLIAHIDKVGKRYGTDGEFIALAPVTLADLLKFEFLDILLTRVANIYFYLPIGGVG